MKPWVKKYQPKNLREVVGQTEAIEYIKQFFQSFPRDKALIISGPYGSGKTSIIQALASEEKTELIELNASDYRREKEIRAVLGPASRQASIFGRRKVILVDEVDGLAGRQDRGGLPAVIDIIAETKFPIFLTTNDVWAPKLKKLRKVARIVELQRPTQAQVFGRLKEIAQIEDFKVSEENLKRVAAHSEGDIRAAINDLQAIGSGLELYNRDRIEEVESSLRMIFKSFDAKAAKDVSNSMSLKPEEFLNWIDENLPAEYSDPQELRDAYDYLGKADNFQHRIMRWQHWRFLMYTYLLASVGVQQAKSKPNPKHIKYAKPNLLKFWIRAAKLKKAKGLAQTIGPKLHASAHVLQRSFLPYFNFIESRNSRMAKGLSDWLGL